MTLYRCIAKGTLPSNQGWSIRMEFNSASTIATVENDWLAHIDGAWTVGASALQAIYPVNVILETTRTEQLQKFTLATTPPRDVLRVVAVREDNPALPGTSTNASVPDNSCMVVKLPTNDPGREGAGRIRLPGPDRTLVTGSEVDAVTAGHVSTAIIGVITNMATSGHTAVKVTYTLTKIGTPVGTTKNLTTAETDRVLRSSRFRVKSRPPVRV